MTSAAEFLRDLAAGLEVYLPAADVDVGSDIERLRDVADDLASLLDSVAKSGEGPIFQAVQRLRGAS